MDRLYEDLQSASPEGYQAIERQIFDEWGKSGSAAMDLLVRRARMALDEGDFEAALDHYSALVDHAPDFAEGYAGRSNVYFRMGMVGPALDDLEHALAIEPRHFGAMSNLAVMLEEIDRPEDALVVYREAARLHPQEPNLQSAVARLELAVEGQDI